MCLSFLSADGFHRQGRSIVASIPVRNPGRTHDNAVQLRQIVGNHYQNTGLNGRVSLAIVRTGGQSITHAVMFYPTERNQLLAIGCCPLYR